MDDVYFETNRGNGLIYILTQSQKVKNDKMLFNLRDYHYFFNI